MFEALKGIMKRLPFKVPGIDSDNGSEFINAHLLRFCEEKEITAAIEIDSARISGDFVPGIIYRGKHIQDILKLNRCGF